MATTAFIRQSGIANDAGFRVVGLEVSQAMDAVGFIKTADTGQIDWATVLKPTTYPAMAGYEIRQLPASALQTANPVLVKILYGTGASSVIFGMQIQVGHTTDGAGTLTGVYSSSIPSYSGANNAAGDKCFFSCDAEHFSMALFLGIAGSVTDYYCIFTLDRLRDESGAALATGVHVFNLASGNPALFILPAGSEAQFPATPVVTPLALYPPGPSLEATMGLGMNFSYVYPYMGCAGNPDMNLIMYPGLAMPLPGGAMLDFSIYGTMHRYVLCGSYNAGLGGNAAANWSIGVRYE